MAGAAEAPDSAVRTLRALVAGSAEPRAELLALLWGPRFDWAHAQALMARRPHAPLPLRQLAQVAARYDSLDATQQQRLRRAVWRSGEERPAWNNPAHAAHPAD